MVTFKDIFKSDFLTSANIRSFSVTDTIIALLLAFALGLFIYYVYKRTYKGVMYSSTYGISLIAIAMITTLVILAVTANIVLSLGMVGALSIVRFRTAVKEPMDIAFMFWAIAVGVVLGAGIIPLAVLGSVIIGAVILFFSNYKTKGSTPYILVINCSFAVENIVINVIKDSTYKHILKSKTVTKNGIELTYEVRVKDIEARAINKLVGIDGVQNAVLVSYNGEYMA